MLNLIATVKNVYPTNEFTDPKTGEVTPPGHKVQMEYVEPVKGKKGQSDGEKIVLRDYNVRLLGDAYKKVIGKSVSVGVGIYLDETTRKPALYIPEGSLPTVLNAAK